MEVAGIVVLVVVGTLVCVLIGMAIYAYTKVKEIEPVLERL